MDKELKQKVDDNTDVYILGEYCNTEKGDVLAIIFISRDKKKVLDYYKNIEKEGRYCLTGVNSDEVKKQLN